METLNRSRYRILVKRFLEGNGEIATVGAVNREESVWLCCGRPFVSINLGFPLSSVAGTHSSLLFRQDIPVQRSQQKYLLRVVRDSSRHYDVNIALHDQSTPRDQMEAMFQALLLEFVLLKTLKVDSSHPWWKDVAAVEDTAENLAEDEESLLRASTVFVEKYFPIFWKGLETSEWRLDHVLFGAADWRSIWDKEVKTKSSGDGDNFIVL